MLTLIKDGSHPGLFCGVLMFDCGWLGWVLCMRKGLVMFNFSFVEDDGGKVLYGDSVKMCECRFNCIFWEVELFMEGLKSGGVSGSSCSSCEDEYWRDSPALLLEFIHKGGVFVDLSLDSFSCKSVVSVCEFDKSYFNVGIKMERWGAVVWDALGT